MIVQKCTIAATRTSLGVFYFMEQTQSEINLKLEDFRYYLNEITKERNQQERRLFELEESKLLNESLIKSIKYVVLKDFKKYKIKSNTDLGLKIVHPLTGRPIDFINITDVCIFDDNNNESYEEALTKVQIKTKKLFPYLETIIF